MSVGKKVRLRPGDPKGAQSKAMEFFLELAQGIVACRQPGRLEESHFEGRIFGMFQGRTATVLVFPTMGCQLRITGTAGF